MKKSRIIEFLGGGCVLEQINETFTKRVDLGDTILRGDDKFHWGRFSKDGTWSTWFGVAPHGWDDSKAVEDVWSRVYEMEADYS